MKNKLIQFFVFVTFFIQYNLVSAQSPIGKWKLVSEILENQDGTKKDMKLEMQKFKPCLANFTYEYTSGGQLITSVPPGCMAANLVPISTWKLTNHKIIFNQKEGKKIITTIYEVTFPGDQMVFSYEYSPAENKILHSKSKKLTITYKRA